MAKLLVLFNRKNLNFRQTPALKFLKPICDGYNKEIFTNNLKILTDSIYTAYDDYTLPKLMRAVIVELSFMENIFN